MNVIKDVTFETDEEYFENKNLTKTEKRSQKRPDLWYPVRETLNEKIV